MSDYDSTQIDLVAVCMLVAIRMEGWPPVGDLAAVATQARDEGSMDRLIAGRVTAAGQAVSFGDTEAVITAVTTQ